MSAQIEQEFSKMMKKHTLACIKALADKYGFDPNEAHAYLATSDSPKKPRAKSPILAAPPAPPPELFGALTVQDNPKVKRGPNGWHAWGKANRDAVATETSLKGRDLTAEMSKRWKALSPDEQAGWKSKASSSSDSEE